MLSRPLRLFIENEIENIFIENIIDVDDALLNEPNSPRPRRKSAKKESELIIVGMTYGDFCKSGKNLNSFKKDELADVLRYYKGTISFIRTEHYTRDEIKAIKSTYDFSLSGKKTDVLERVQKIYGREKIAIFMQKRIRGMYTRKLMALRGPALKNRKLCVNDSDFYTLEPIKDIPLSSFFSYTGSGDFVYGFDISSLLTLLKNSKRLQNPYNRESMEQTVHDIYYAERLSKIVHPNGETPIVSCLKPPSQTLRYELSNQSLIRVQSILNVDNSVQYCPRTMVNKINEIRSKSINERVRGVFMEIDHLGFYTQPNWFSDLQRFSFIRFYSGLYDIWHYRAQLSFDTKRKICPLQDPFTKVMTEPINYSNLTEDQIREMSLEVMEDMIFTGLDNDNRSLGAFHVLSALTLVSVPARSNMPWLYESLVF